MNAAAQPALAAWGANREQKGLQSEVDAYDKADRAAATAHQARMPQQRPELQGPRDESGSPELNAKTPTTQDRMQWAQEGTSIPSRKALMSKLMDDLTVNEPAREEQRQFRASESEAQRQQRTEQFKA